MIDNRSLTFPQLRNHGSQNLRFTVFMARHSRSGLCTRAFPGRRSWSDGSLGARVGSQDFFFSLLGFSFARTPIGYSADSSSLFSERDISEAGAVQRQIVVRKHPNIVGSGTTKSVGKG